MGLLVVGAYGVANTLQYFLSLQLLISNGEFLVRAIHQIALTSDCDIACDITCDIACDITCDIACDIISTECYVTKLRKFFKND